MAALVLPMLVVAGYLAVDIRTATSDRADARAESAEVERFVAVAAFSDAIGDESLVIIDRDATEDDLAAARSATDAAMVNLRSEEVGLAVDQLAEVEASYTELLALRETLGDRPFEIRLTAQTELRSGELTMSGDVTPALESLSALPAAVLADFDFAEEVVASSSAELLDDYFLLQRYRADLGREVATLSRVTSLPSNLVDANVVELVAVATGATDLSRQFLADLGSPQLLQSVAPVVETDAMVRYEAQRTSLSTLEAGSSSSVDAEQLQDTAAEIDAALSTAGETTLAELDERTSAAAFNANRDLVVSALIGFWLLVLVGVILRLLYRAIKAPIEKVTEQAKQISNVELPVVVEQMRRGEIDTAPIVEKIPVVTNDEIGELVRAFNEMHHTAVELTAEQANSRRVVADMFVNLGRRNQRLVNRLLKGLTVLEQHEQDPDKLNSLYEIDHVATRMRRNAESLLVLAGAGQSRRWEKPVPLYDLARASLAEVEDYDRVQIDVSEGIEIDGGLVADLTHLLAELIENGLTFSPPTSPVELIGRTTDDGVLIAVSDNGVGMSDIQMAHANRLIADAADEDETPSEFLGHYVVGRLAARHGIRVELIEGPAGGVTARVFLSAYGTGAGTRDDLPRPADGSGPVPPTDPGLAVTAAIAAPVVAAQAAPVTAPEPVVTAPEPVVTAPEPQPLVVPGLASEPEPVVEREIDVPEPADAVEPVGFAPNPATFDWPSPSAVDPLTAEHRKQPAANEEWNWPSEKHVDAIPPVVAPTAGPLDAPPADESSRPDLPDVDASPVNETPPTVAKPPAVGAPPVIASPPVDVSFDALGGATDQLNRAADDAVNDALSVFGVSRRTPGAQLPTTDLFSGSMRLGLSDDSVDPGPDPVAAPVEQRSPIPTPSTSDLNLGDEEQVRFDLSGFQHGTNRADRELGGSDS